MSQYSGKIYIKVSNSNDWKKLKKIDNSKMNEYWLCDAETFFDKKGQELILNTGEWGIDEFGIENFVKDIVDILKDNCIVIGMTCNFNVDYYTYLVYYFGKKVINECYDDLDENEALTKMASSCSFESVSECISYLNDNGKKITAKEKDHLKKFEINIDFKSKKSEKEKDAAKEKKKIMKELENWKIQFTELPIKYQNDPEIARAAWKYQGEQTFEFEDLSDELQNNKEFLKTIALDDNSLKLFKEKYRQEFANDREIFLNNRFIEYASITLRDDEEIVKHAVSMDPSKLQYASERLRNNKNIIDTIMKKNYLSGDWIKYVGEDYKNNREFIKKAISKGLTLEYLSDEFKDDEEIVTEIIDNNPFSLKYASDRICDNKDIVILAVSKYPETLQYASDRLKDDEDVVKCAVNAYHGDRCINYVSDRLKNKINELKNDTNK